tara:strand:+ start:586 stop:957 length:372 start_codon:yes stop_codon:yes gene_type:complete
MEPGPELDSRVAQEVMGWKGGAMDGYVGWWGSDNNLKAYKHWSPSTSIKDAIEVLEKIKPPSEPATLTWLSDSREWAVQVEGGKASAPTLAHAICLAALRAVKRLKAVEKDQDYVDDHSDPIG